jgi:hypothetical protein
MAEWLRGRHHRGPGQSLTEFALFLPIVLVLLLGIGDLARVYASMITIESAAREAADWGSTKPGHWTVGAEDPDCPGVPLYECTVQKMEERACTPATHLEDYVGDADGSACTNPSFSCELYQPAGGSWNDCMVATTCADQLGSSAEPCKVRVRLTYTFDLLLPTELLTLPPTITLVQSAVFNIADDHGSGG